MSHRIARLTLLSLSLILCAAAGTAADLDRAPDRRTPALVRELTLSGEIRSWIESRLGALLAGRERVSPKCSAGIDPNGRPCAMPAAGCRCEP